MILSTKEDRQFTIKFKGESHTISPSPTEFAEDVGSHLMRLFSQYLDMKPSISESQEQIIEIVVEQPQDIVAPVEVMKAKRILKPKAKITKRKK